MSRLSDHIHFELKGSASLLCSALFLVLLSSSAQAYYSTMETGSLLNPKTYKAKAESQFITEGDTGVNLLGRFDMGFSESANLKALVGIGTTDFQLGAFYKWVPIPDHDKQPAIGLTGGVLYARNFESNELSLRLHPLISKEFKVEWGLVSPYASLPIGFRNFDQNRDGKDETQIPVQLALGGEFKLNSIENFTLITEVGFDIRKAFTYFSVGVTFFMDPEKGIEFK